MILLELQRNERAKFTQKEKYIELNCKVILANIKQKNTVQKEQIKQRKVF